MKKFIFLLILLPAIAAIGHDAYRYTEEPEKGMRVSDLGLLWSKYHPESHDQWKIVVGDIATKFDKTVGAATKELNKNIAKVLPQDEEQTKSSTETEQPEAINEYEKEFKQENEIGKKAVIKPVDKTTTKQNVTTAHKVIGFLLEQYAVVVFGGLALLIFLLNAMIVWIMSEPSSEKKIARLKKQRNK